MLPQKMNQFYRHLKKNIILFISQMSLMVFDKTLIMDCKTTNLGAGMQICEQAQTAVIQIHSQKLAARKSSAGLFPCCHQADIRMRLHHLLRTDDNKSAASC